MGAFGDERSFAFKKYLMETPRSERGAEKSAKNAT